ncbi:PIN domain-containing protein [soil metagenome]
MAFATALCDANTLYPAPIRDLLVRLGISGVVRLRWTEAIHEEWIRSVLADRHDLTRTQLERTRALMDRAVQDCLIRDYEHRIEGLELPDPEDRHVLAAAIVGGVQRILTFNTRDFPPAAVAPFGIEVQDPDAFILELLDARRERLLEALREQRSALRDPLLSAEQLLTALGKAGLVRSAHELASFVAQL